MLPIDEMIITQTFTMARWQIVVKKSEATKQTKDQNNNKNKTNKQKTFRICACVRAFMLYALNFDKYVFVENV